MNVFWSASPYIATALFVGTWIFAERSDDRDDEIDREQSARLSCGCG
jgi:hypothetical protein